MVDDYLPAFRHRRARRWHRVPGLTALAVAVACAGAVALAGDVYGGSPASVEQIHVAPGDTLWAIAGRTYGAGGIRDHIDAIVEINHLRGGAIEAGQTLTIPAP